tara:strand:+ start:3631 stop:4353 length:723 start_codon:yes stop_codon:yes gene_type:complete
MSSENEETIVKEEIIVKEEMIVKEDTIIEEENEITSEYENNLSIFEDVVLPYKKYKNLIDELNSITSIVPKLNYEKQKDADKIEKNVLTLLSLYRELNNNYSNFFNKSILDMKRNIKLEKKKKKENKDKSKYYVNIPKRSPKFILEMLNRGPEDKVSQSQVLTALIQMIKKCIETSHSTYAVFKETGKADKTKFKIEGELLDFFNKIKNEAELRGNIITIPEVMGYPNLMSYMQYFVYKD